MSVSSSDSGHLESTLDQEHTLSTKTDQGVYVLVVDLSEMLPGDITVLSIKTKCKSGGTSRLAFQMTYAHTQAEPNSYSPPVPIETEIICTLMQTDGTARHYDWNLLKVG